MKKMLSKLLRGANKFSEYLMNEVFDFAKVIVDKNLDATGRDQEILAIIKSEIVRDKLS